MANLKKGIYLIAINNTCNKICGSPNAFQVEACAEVMEDSDENDELVNIRWMREVNDKCSGQMDGRYYKYHFRIISEDELFVRMI